MQTKNMTVTNKLQLKGDTFNSYLMLCMDSLVSLCEWAHVGLWGSGSCWGQYCG